MASIVTRHVLPGPIKSAVPPPSHQQFAFSARPVDSKRAGVLIRAVSETTSLEPASSTASSTASSSSSKLVANAVAVQSLLMEICDETSVAELMLKVGDFKLRVKRDVGKLKSSTGVPPITVAPPVPSAPMVESAAASVSTAVVPASPSKTSSSSLSALLASPASGSRFRLLEAAADEGLHFVTSPKVGLFRKSRVVKGKSGRPLCEEGQSVKEGQVVCYVEQLGTQQPVEAENSGEVMKILCKDGEPVGYGDPLIAIRPAFPGIK